MSQTKFRIYSVLGVASVGCLAAFTAHERADRLESDAGAPALARAGSTAPHDPSTPTPAIRLDSVDVALIGRDGERIGTAQLTTDSAGVRIRTLADLSPGEHGFHIHAHGICDPPEFASAGPHYGPEDRHHGFLDPDGPHAGDLPMLEAGSNGDAEEFDFTTGRVRLSERSLLNPAGTTLIIHAQSDDYRTGTGGGSGDRIACGVISPARS